jgi:hypothetical protein
MSSSKLESDSGVEFRWSLDELDIFENEIRSKGEVMMNAGDGLMSISDFLITNEVHDPKLKHTSEENFKQKVEEPKVKEVSNSDIAKSDTAGTMPAAKPRKPRIRDKSRRRHLEKLRRAEMRRLYERLCELMNTDKRAKKNGVLSKALKYIRGTRD